MHDTVAGVGDQMAGRPESWAKIKGTAFSHSVTSSK